MLPLWGGLSHMVGKGPHQPFGQLLQRRSDLPLDLLKCLLSRDIHNPVASPLEKLPEGLMRSFWPFAIALVRPAGFFIAELSPQAHGQMAFRGRVLMCGCGWR